MKKLDIRKQVRLGFPRTLEICLNGVYFRLFRSMITVAIIGIAIAFMMYMLGGSVLGRSVSAHARDAARAYKLYSVWLSWLEEPMSRPELFRLAATSAPNDARLRALGPWGGIGAARMRALLGSARRSARYIRFFDGLSPGRRFLLLGSQEHADLFEHLHDPAVLGRLRARLENVGSLQLPGDISELKTVLADYAAQRADWDAIVHGRRNAISELRGRYAGTGTARLLAHPPPDLPTVLGDLGFTDDLSDLPTVSAQARNNELLARLNEALRHPGLKRDVAKKLGMKPLLVKMADLARLYLARGGPDLFAASVARHEIVWDIDAPSLQRFFKDFRRRERILRIEEESAEFGEGFLGFGNRTLWLIAVSFVVCIVGIANAMLMSVMERFREIATMKCLGATDAFVMTLFVLESCMLGVVGGLIGALLGLLLSLPAALVRYGGLVWNVLPLADIFGAMGIAVVVGILLAAIASVYPAWVAARLVPMEAMRLE